MLESHEFEAAWERYRGQLLPFIRRKVASLEEAEDLLQELFLRVHTGLCCLQAWEGTERWIYRVARNLIVDRYRSHHPQEEYEDHFESPYVEGPHEDDPTARLAFSLRDMIDRLPEPYRSALVLSAYEGLRQAELAARLGISLSAAKSRVRRAREKLKALLLECCHFELDHLGGIIDYDERCARCDLERAAKAR